MKQLVLFASGSGSNVENIIRYFDGKPAIAVSCVFTNKRDAYVIDRCNSLGIPVFYFNSHSFYHSHRLLEMLTCLAPDLIVLAGFLLKIPKEMVDAFPGKIINIHPALLPKYGGKGMYGRHVHAAVKEQQETETGITIHYVNEYYDEGAIIKQFKTAVGSQDTVETIAKKVQALEHDHFPEVIEELLLAR